MWRYFDYWNAIYAWTDGWELLDIQMDAVWDTEPGPRPPSERQHRLMRDFPSLGEPGPPYLLGVVWRHEVTYPGEALVQGADWEAYATAANWAFEEAGPAPPPPVGRPAGKPPPEGDRDVPYTDDGASAAAEASSGGGGTVYLLAAAFLLTAVIVYAQDRRSG